MGLTINNKMTIKEPDAQPCKGCLRWDRFQDKCLYYWPQKSFCTRRVTTQEELAEESKFMG